MNAPLSAVLITHNAAAQLAECLASLRFCNEIIVVDSGSTDSTVAIATAAGARVIPSIWRGFGPQKQFAIEQAKHDWVLCIDSDEEITPTLRATIIAALARPTAVAYRLNRCNHFMGRDLRHGEGWPDYVVRLFDRRRAHWSNDVVHERVVINNGHSMATLTGDLRHYSALSLEDYLAKQNRYSGLQAAAALARGEKAHLWQLVFSPIYRFIKFYFLRRGFLDGVPGLIHILIGCGASFTKYAKMRAAQSHTQQ